MTNLTKIRIFLAGVMLSLAGALYAQSNGDKLFMEGQKLQQTMTIAAQNQAIKKFKSAKVVYTSAEKKKMCNNQIAICNTNISNIKKGAGKRKVEAEKPRPIVHLSLSQKELMLEAARSENTPVWVTAASKQWEIQYVYTDDLFATAYRNLDSTGLVVSTKTNFSTLERAQAVIVSTANEKDTLTVRQKGAPVVLDASPNLLEFKLKGGNKSMEIRTNSDSVIADNDNLTWYVDSKPAWVEVNMDISSGRGLFAKTKAGSSATPTQSTSDGLKLTKLKVMAVPLLKSDPEYKSGRRGEIIFASQDKKYKVIVVQQK